MATAAAVAAVVQMSMISVVVVAVAAVAAVVVVDSHQMLFIGQRQPLFYSRSPHWDYPVATDLEYKKRILTFDWRQLQDLWQQIQQRQTTDWEPGKAFEYFILRCFQLEGADVVYPYSVTFNREVIEQLDGIIHSGNFDCLIEAKDHVERVNFAPIAKMRSQLQRRPAATIGIVFSNSGFTEAAITLARFVAPQTVLLWSGAEIEESLEKHNFREYLLRRYRFFVHHGDPAIDVREGEL